MKRVTKYSLETRERAVRLVWETEEEHGSQWAAICMVVDIQERTPNERADDERQASN